MGLFLREALPRDELPLLSGGFLTEGNETCHVKASAFHNGPYLDFSRKDGKPRQVQPIYRWLVDLCCYVFPSRTYSTSLKGNTRTETFESGNVIHLRE